MTGKCPLCGSPVMGYRDEPGYCCSEVFCTFDDDLVDAFLAPFASGTHEMQSW